MQSISIWKSKEVKAKAGEEDLSIQPLARKQPSVSLVGVAAHKGKVHTMKERNEMDLALGSFLKFLRGLVAVADQVDDVAES